MPKQVGPSVTAFRSRQALLANQQGAAAEADRLLGEVLASAHAATQESVRRLDVIAEEIESAVVQRERLAVDTPLGVREFQRFLLAKQREIRAVVAEASELARAKSIVLEALRERYRG